MGNEAVGMGAPMPLGMMQAIPAMGMCPPPFQSTSGQLMYDEPAAKAPQLPNAYWSTIYSSEEGQPVLLADSQPPALAVYEQQKTVKIVVSTFNLQMDETQLSQLSAGQQILIHLTTNEGNRGKATVFGSSLGGGVEAPRECRLLLELGDSFEPAHTEVEYDKTTITITMHKRVRGRGGPGRRNGP